MTLLLWGTSNVSQHFNETVSGRRGSRAAICGAIPVHGEGEKCQQTLVR